MRIRAAALLLAALAVAGCSRGGGGGAPASAPAPRPVALVNGEPITPEQLARELRQTRVQAEAQGTADVLRRRALDDLIERALLLQQARARSIVVGQEQVERAFLQVRAEYPGTHFDDLLAQERLSQGELKARLKDQLTVERLVHEEVFPRVQVADADVQRWYGEHGAELAQPERAHVLQVVLPTREAAAAARERLRKDPARFSEVARQVSIAPEGQNGGDLGWIGRGAGFPEVFDLCFTLPLNSISDVVPSPYGFHVFRVVARKPAARPTLEEARGAIAERLLREQRAHAQEEYLTSLRARATIQIDEAALAAVNP